MPNKHLKIFRKVICLVVLSTFGLSIVASPTGASAEGLGTPSRITPSVASVLPNLPAVGQAIWLTPIFQPPVLRGMTVHPENPLLFDFIVDRGQDKINNDLLKVESTKLIKYFLASMTIPDKDAWVNLSPYEKDRIIPGALGQTEMGRQMLEQDYILKQLASSLTNPDKELGQKFWNEVKSRAKKQFGTIDIPLNTFNKVWIIPDGATVVEKDGFAYITESKLNVMLDEDYNLSSQVSSTGSVPALQVSSKGSVPVLQGTDPGDKGTVLDAKGSVPDSRDVSKISTAVFREMILPKLIEEVNTGKNFSQTRQVYQSVILAAWYKKALKDSLLGRIYADKSKVAGVESDVKDIKQKVYEQYLEAFKKGAYNVIKEEDNGEELIPRKYFSGGESFLNLPVQYVKSSSAVNNVLVTVAASSSVGTQAIVRAATPESIEEQKVRMKGNESADQFSASSTLAGNSSASPSESISAENLFDVNQIINMVAENKLADKDVLIFDYDGTLAKKKEAMSPEMVDALLELIKTGKKIIILSNGDFERLKSHLDASANIQGRNMRESLTGNNGIWLYEARGGGAYEVSQKGYRKDPASAIPFENDEKVEKLASLLTSIGERFREENIELQLFKSETMVFVRFRLLRQEKIPEILAYLQQQIKDRGLELPDGTGPFIDKEPFVDSLNGSPNVDHLYHAWFVSTDKGTTIKNRIIPIFAQNDLSKAIYFGNGFQPGGSDAEVLAVKNLMKVNMASLDETLVIAKSLAKAVSSPVPANPSVASSSLQDIQAKMNELSTRILMPVILPVALYTLVNERHDLSSSLTVRYHKDGSSVTATVSVAAFVNELAGNLGIENLTIDNISPKGQYDNYPAVPANIIKKFDEGWIDDNLTPQTRTVVIDAIAEFQSGFKVLVSGNTEMLVGIAANPDIVRLEKSSGRKWMKRIDQVPAPQRKAGYDWKTEYLTQIARHVKPLNATDLAGHVVVHGTVARFVKSIQSGALDEGDGFGGPGLYLDLEENSQMARSYALRAGTRESERNLNNQEEERPMIMTGHFKKDSSARVAQIKVSSDISFPDFEKGEFPVHWADDPNLKTLMMEAADVIKVQNAHDHMVVVHASAGQVIQWDNVQPVTSFSKPENGMPSVGSSSLESDVTAGHLSRSPGGAVNINTRLADSVVAIEAAPQLSASSALAPGGIDFDPSKLNLQIKRDGRGVPLPLPQQNLENINIKGLYPVIINILPINAQTLPILGQVK